MKRGCFQGHFARCNLTEFSKSLEIVSSTRSTTGQVDKHFETQEQGRGGWKPKERPGHVPESDYVRKSVVKEGHQIKYDYVKKLRTSRTEEPRSKQPEAGEAVSFAVRKSAAVAVDLKYVSKYLASSKKKSRFPGPEVTFCVTSGWDRGAHAKSGSS